MGDTAVAGKQQQVHKINQKIKQESKKRKSERRSERGSQRGVFTFTVRAIFWCGITLELPSFDTRALLYIYKNSLSSYRSDGFIFLLFWTLLSSTWTFFFFRNIHGRRRRRCGDGGGKKMKDLFLLFWNGIIKVDR